MGTGIASIWGRDAMSMATGQLSLSEAYPDRFVLGIGVSHQPMVDMIRGHAYDKPLATMSAYLDAMDQAIYVSPRARVDHPRAGRARPQDARPVRRARPRAPTRTSSRGAHGVRPRGARPGPLLCPEQAVVLSTDPEVARAAARQHMATYLTLPNYTNNLRRLGWTDADLGDGGSDQLVDAIVAWGDEDAIVARVQAHLDAGADHVAVQVLDAVAGRAPDAAVAGPGPRIALALSRASPVH